MHSLLWTFISLPLFCSLVRAFSFTASPASECDDLTLSWTGGTGPFQLHLIPAFGTPRNISIPPSAQGSYSTQLPFAKDQKFILTMSDSTGFGAGGSTQVLVTGQSRGGRCNTAPPSVDFTFELNSALQQCRPYAFSGYGGAIQPVTIMGIVPGGTSFVLNPPVGPTEYQWNANVAQETTILFMMIDSQGRQGGSSDLRIVGNSADRGCLDASSPSSTATGPPTTSSTAPTSSSSSTASPSPGLSIAAIAGTAIGGFLFLAVLVTLGLFCLKKRQDVKRRSNAVDLTYDPVNNNSRMYPFSGDNLNTGTITASPLLPMAGQHAANPFDTPHSTLAPSTNSVYQPAPSEFRSSQNFSSGSQPGFNPYGYSHPTGSEFGAGPQPAISSPYGYSHSTPSEFGAGPQPGVSNPYGYSHAIGSEYGAGAQPGGSNPHGYSRSTGSEYGAGAQAGGSNPHGNPRSTGSEYGAGVAAQSTSDNMTSAQRKAMQAGVSTYTPSRFIVHTDVEDVYPPPNEDGVVELPPQYSERRAAPPEPSTSELPYQ